MSDPNLPFSEPELAPLFDGSAQPGLARDPHFGQIDIRLDAEHGTVEVEGEGIPRGEVRRSATAKPNKHVPIGTRDSTGLTLGVGGHPARITPARGHISKRSYRVDVHAGGTRYRLVPHSSTTSKLLREKKRIAEFTSCGDGSVEAQWQGKNTPTATDAAIGYALAAAFGTGARSTGDLLLEALDALLPV